MFLRLFTLLLIQVFQEGNSPTLFDNSFSLSERRVIIEGEDRKGPYKLPDLFILENSEIVIKDTLLLEENKDYIINRKFSTIFFIEGLKRGESANIRYHYFPFDIKKEYKRRSISSFMGVKPNLYENKKEEPKTPEYEKTGIILGGAKTFSIGMNSQSDYSFDQSLKVNISGDITEGLSINGVLSDENTPLEPEGTTESLEELDRLFVTVKGEIVEATLGDFELCHRLNSMQTIKRELLGITGKIEKGGKGINAAFGIPRGKFNALHIKGLEGKQGPYQLKSMEGEDDIVIVSGTETVYLDGMLMKRGERNDYIMNYNLAQLTFTSKRLITEESDIVVEFQYTRIGFRRNLYFTRLCYGNSTYNVSSFFIKEGDEVSQTEGFEFTEEQRALLSQVGDDTTQNWLESALYVGKGKGTYSFSDSFYIYKGYKKGEWEVSFTYVGETNGDYVYSDSLAGFIYMGANNGDYISKIRVPLPERIYNTGLHLGFENKERIKLQTEILGSDYDRNILSGLNDNDNQGYFADIDGELALMKSGWGDINTVAGYRYRNAHFKQLSRAEGWDFEERWNLKSHGGMEEIKNGGIIYKSENLCFSQAKISELKRENIKATLREGLFSLKRKNLPSLSLFHSKEEITGDTILTEVKKMGLDIAYPFFRIIPTIYAKQELRNELLLKRWREAGAEMGFLMFKKSKLVLGYSKRFNELYNTNKKIYERESGTTTGRFSLAIEEVKAFHSNLNVTSRKKIFTSQFPGENTELLFIEYATHFIPIARKIDIETNYSVTGKNSILFQEFFYEVEEGKGDYRKDTLTGDYYADTLGNYKRRIARIGEGNPVTSLKTDIRVRFTPAKIIRCNLAASIMEDNRSEEKLPIYTLRLKKFLDDSLTVNGIQSLDGNISIYPLKPTILSYSFNFLKGLNNEFVSRAERTYSDMNEFRIEQKLSDKSRVRLNYRRKKNINESLEMGLEKDERKEELTPEYARYILENLEVRIEATTGNIKIEEPLWYSQLGLITIKSEMVSPSLEYTMKNRAIINSRLSITKNRSKIDKEDLPQDVESFYPIGITADWKIGANISITHLFSMNISYNGLNRPDKKTMHSANAELRADF